MNTGRYARHILASTGIRVFAMFVLILGGSLMAWSQQITGSIAGTVKDESGALVTTATIKATNVDTGFSRATAAGSDGAYLIQYLPIGKYTVEVNAAGFKKFLQQNLVIAVDQTQQLNVVLTVGGASQTITVTEAPPLVETTTAELGRTVTPAEIVGLPLVNRNAYAELSLTPGVNGQQLERAEQRQRNPEFPDRRTFNAGAGKWRHRRRGTDGELLPGRRHQ